MDNKERMQIIANNITKFRKEKGITQKDLAEQIGIRPSTLSDYINLRSAPSFGIIQKLADFFEINKSDIDTTFKETDTTTSTTLQAIQSVSERLSESRRVIVLDTAQKQLDEQKREERELSEPVYLYDVNLVSETAAASGFGYGFGYDDSDRETVQVDEKPPRHDIATRVSGDSMEPDYHDGDILYLVDKGLTTYNGELAVIAYGDRSYFKKIYTEKGHIRLVSLNDKYEDIILDFPPAEDTHIKIFAVVGRYGKEK